ncbi:hypothetical protein A9Z42_0082030 [Trichoderma parareesei]|uniref:Uncharacterized protein n=1 Tax=Trichoderma parareesei TaxID=858221 RepID=A0A2H3A830_TRIPA|nr:hypothetical protein A9Z42_0082030 [Trichoderma parareesei]
MIADLIASTNGSNPGLSLAGRRRQSALRVMVVGDSMSQGRAVAVDKGLIQGVLESTPADLILFMLGFNDMGWFYSDAIGTIDSVETFISNARAANPNIKLAVANVPQRSFIGGREDLVENTEIYNALLAKYITQWTTEQSPIHLVELEQNYDCAPDSCPAGYDGLHPTAWDDPNLVRPLPEPGNFQMFSSPQGVTATWDADHIEWKRRKGYVQVNQLIR